MDENLKPGEFTLNLAENEVRDLKFFWDDLSWYERDESINSARSGINAISFARLSSEQKNRSNILLNETQNLWNRNTCPSKIRLWLHLVPYEGEKYIFRECLAILPYLTSDQLIELGKYLGVPNITNSYPVKRDFLLQVYTNVGMNGSLAIFYALRNFLGKQVRFNI